MKIHDIIKEEMRNQGYKFLLVVIQCGGEQIRSLHKTREDAEQAKRDFEAMPIIDRILANGGIIPQSLIIQTLD